MNLSALFINRPVTTTLLQLSIVIFGVIGYRALPVSDLPAIDFPTISVQASLPGANPETMASAVATPLEKQFSAIAGISSISSTNGTGQTSITLQFDLDRDIDAAAQDVQLAISRTRNLPPDMPQPPSFQKVNPADFPILFLTLSSETLPLSQINEYAEINVAQRISMVKGVAQVNIFGSQKFAVQIDVDPRQLAARGLATGRTSRARSAATASTADRHAVRPGSHVRREDRRAAHERRSVPAADRELSRRPSGPASTKSRTSTTASRTTSRRAGSTARARSTWRSTGSPARTRSRSSIRFARCCHRFRRSCPRALGLLRSAGSVAVDSRIDSRHQAHAAA